MARAHQICSICYREFTRKSNAERHNENLHASHAHIIPLGEFRFGGGGLHVRNKVGLSSTNGNKKKEDLLNDVFERIGKDFEGCEHEFMILSDHDRAECLSLVIIFALRSEDPKQTMRAFLKGLKKFSLSLKMIRYVETGLGLSYYAAKQLLINTLK
ncbi:MAG: hypothetical protein WA461_15235 [Nitrososphaeraceae archaeon]